MGKKVFRTRFGALYIVIYGALLYLGWFTSKISGSFVGLIIMGVCVMLSVFAFSSMYYVLTDKEIQIYYLWCIAGKPYGRIFISAITSVERSYSPAQGTAGSAKRLRFHFKNLSFGYPISSHRLNIYAIDFSSALILKVGKLQIQKMV